MLKCNTFILTPVNLTVHAGMYFSCIPRRPTRPHRHFLSSTAVYTGQPVYTEKAHTGLPVHIAPQKGLTFVTWRTFGHFESTHLSRHLGTYSCPQGHLEATRVPSPLRVHLISIRTFEGYSSLPSFTITKGCYFPTGLMEIALLHNVIS